MSNEQHPEQLVSHETVQALLLEVNRNVGQLAPAPIGYRYDEFSGSLNQIPTRFVIYQMPVEVNADARLPVPVTGLIAKIGIKPESIRGTEFAFEDNYTYFSFYRASSGVILRKEHGITPLSSRGYCDDAGVFDEQAYDSADEEHRKRIRVEEFDNELDTVYEQEAQDLLTSLSELTPDLERRRLVKLAERDYQKYLKKMENPTKKGAVAKLLGFLGLRTS